MRPLYSLALAIVLPGCAAEVETRPVPAIGAGLLTVDWSISGVQDPAACRQSGADRINIAVETVDGFSLGEFEDYCEVFRTSIELEPGDYFADAVLLDPGGRARTTPADLGLVDIFGNDELVVPIDFPPDSFF